MMEASMLLHLEGEAPKPVAVCVCGKCDNTFLVLRLVEHEPSYCCYCGIKFAFYDHPDGTTRNLAGMVIPSPEDPRDDIADARDPKRT